MDTIENREQIHKILQERDIEGRPLYFLMKQHPLLLFKIETTIELEWEGDIPLYRRESLFLSTMARIFWNQSRAPFGSRHEMCRRCRGEVSPFQFSLARRSPMLKYLTYFLQVFVIAVTMQVCTLLSIEGSNRVINYDDSANPSETILDTAR